MKSYENKENKVRFFIYVLICFFFLIVYKRNHNKPLFGKNTFPIKKIFSKNIRPEELEMPYSEI
ncbi:hypothetical protein LEP1GSC137_3120 [Leptospira borgpetersenii str. Noumea 25]|nr:hypothetical protein LEP1GSC137_3120 [Leptospira borgpetersenii str. Noumea 25]